LKQILKKKIKSKQKQKQKLGGKKSTRPVPPVNDGI